MTLAELKETIEETILQEMRDDFESEDEDFDDEEEEDERLKNVYTMQDVNKCGSILKKFITELEESEGDETKILKCVKTLALKLNKLNERTDYTLIQAEQREIIGDFIIEAANTAGLESEDDITEYWHEW